MKSMKGTKDTKGSACVEASVHRIESTLQMIERAPGVGDQCTDLERGSLSVSSPAAVAIRRSSASAVSVVQRSAPGAVLAVDAHPIATSGFFMSFVPFLHFQSRSVESQLTIGDQPTTR